MMLAFRSGNRALLGVLTTLRVLIGMSAAVFIWFSLVLIIGTQETLVGVLAPVWLGGLVGGVVCSLFSLRQGVPMAFVCGVLLMLGFLWWRHVVMGLGLGDNAVVTLWPVWFPPSFYVGAFGWVRIAGTLGE